MIPLKKYLYNASSSEKILIDSNTKQGFSYAELDSLMCRIVRFYTHKKITGKKIALLLDNSLESAILLLASISSDVVFIPLNVKNHSNHLARILEAFDVYALITSRALQEYIPAQKLPRINIIFVEDMIASHANDGEMLIPGETVPGRKLKCILHTSGTTGDVRGVMIAEDVLISKIEMLRDALRLEEGERFISFLSLSHGFGMITGFLAPLFSGCIVYVGAFDPFMAKGFWDFIKKENITSFAAVPHILLLLKKMYKLKKCSAKQQLKKIISATAPLPQKIFDWYKEVLDISITNSYGMSELAATICIRQEPDQRTPVNCVGAPVNSQIIIKDDSGHTLPCGSVGEVAIQSPYVMLGYYEQPEATKNILHDGTIQTGDMGFLDSKGRLHLVGRKKEIIIKKGYTIYPNEIDAFFMKMRNVRIACTFGVEDDNYGEKIITVLVSSCKEHGNEMYYNYAAQAMPTYLLPDEIVLVPDIPVTASGKLSRKEVKRWYLDGMNKEG